MNTSKTEGNARIALTLRPFDVVGLVDSFQGSHPFHRAGFRLEARRRIGEPGIHGRFRVVT